MLESNGFNVVDVGVDVPAETFVKAVRDSQADVLALSALLLTVIGMRTSSNK
jgi:5-methyltetrahydrofolate--homocysteine methyltransferase